VTTMHRPLAAAAGSLALLATLGLGGIAYAQDDVDLAADLCVDLGANVDTPVADLAADVQAQIAAAVGVDLDDLLGTSATKPAAVVLDCGEQPVDPPVTDEPTIEPPATTEPTTEPPVIVPPTTEQPDTSGGSGSSGSGSTSPQFDATPDTAPETGRP
jgi:hypothetical protein